MLIISILYMKNLSSREFTLAALASLRNIRCLLQQLCSKQLRCAAPYGLLTRPLLKTNTDYLLEVCLVLTIHSFFRELTSRPIPYPFQARCCNHHRTDENQRCIRKVLFIKVKQGPVRVYAVTPHA